MPKNDDLGFDLFVAAPDAYKDRQLGPAPVLGKKRSLKRAPRDWDGHPCEVAGPRGLMKKARRNVRGAKRVATKASRVALRAHPMTLAVTTAKYAGRGLAAATGPIRRKIFRAFFGKLIARRARLVSWQRRRSLAPIAAETTLARRWAVRYVKRRGILGRLVGTALAGDAIGDPATASVVTASIPVIIALAKRALRSAEGHGAPIDPRRVSAASADDNSDIEDDRRETQQED